MKSMSVDEPLVGSDGPLPVHEDDPIVVKRSDFRALRDLLTQYRYLDGGCSCDGERCLYCQASDALQA